ncbi:MAG: phospholipase D-like domain-containing protein [Chloroflexota bacterium]
MTKTYTPLKQSALSGLGYGLGLLLGNLLSFALFNLIPANWFLFGNQAVRLVFGLLLAFFVSGLGGLVGGALGGWTLPPIGQGQSRRGQAWRSGVTFGVGYGLLLFPLFLIVSLLSFYEIGSTPVYVFGVVFGLVGVLFGLLMGVSLGLWTVGRRFSPIIRWSVTGFGLGGAALGAAIWEFIFNVAAGDVSTGPYGWLLLGLFMFGGLGGMALGHVYHKLAEDKAGSLLPAPLLTLKGWRRRVLIVGLVLFFVALLIRPVLGEVGDLLTPSDAGLAAVLDLPTTGTHWLSTVSFAPNAVNASPALAASADGRLALAWVQDGTLWLQEGQWAAANQQTVWQPAYQAAVGMPSAPTAAITDNGRIHLAWTDADAILVSQCQNGDCTPPVAVAPSNQCAQQSGQVNKQPALAANGDEVLLVWANESGMVPYAAWSEAETPPAMAAGCVPGAAAAPQLDSAFRLVYETAAGAIGLAQFDGTAWLAEGEVGNGRYPTITADTNNRSHLVYCTDQELIYQFNGQQENIAYVDCLNRPALALDNQGQVHVVWFGDAVENVTGVTNAASLLYESVRTADGWTEPAIVATASPEANPALAVAGDGSLHLAWLGADALSYAAQVQYACDPATLSAYGRILYDIARQDAYLFPGEPTPYCQNRYDRLILTPNPKPEYNLAQPPTSNGAFDVLGDLIRGAQYEVLFSTMWYDAAENNDSPGSVVAAAVGDLYRQLQAHPEQYPRGLTVRILLGNPPEVAVGDATGQLWSLLADLRHAGIDTMVDEELGWRLQVADYEGNLPHSHVKTVIIDGQTAVAAGFNMSYEHFPVDHASGKGNGRFDMAIQVTGPVAQAAQRMFDDMWAGADERYCLNLNPPLGAPWQVTCFDRSATADHTPEVLKFYLGGGESDAFSLYRSKVFDQADVQMTAVLASAQKTIDIIQVQFTLDMVCNLNLLFDVCTADDAPSYLPALVQAMQNGAHVRVLVKPGPFEGVENTVALNALQSRLDELGLGDRFEFRYFNGPVHPKVVLIDDQVLIVGSQNFHYSAFGTGGGLNEYSIAVEDPQATADFKQIFEAEWAIASPPVEENR